jgi:ABC-type multidrug transport system fused ATPase/permease subunit
MKDGAIVEQGTHNELLQKKAHYARLVELDTFKAV